jgi:hypothetical protein
VDEDDSMAEAVSEPCRGALLQAKGYASQIVAGVISTYDGAHRIASEFGDCYPYLGQDIELVDLLGAFSGHADEYQELSLDPVKTREIDEAVLAAAAEFMRISDASDL